MRLHRLEITAFGPFAGSEVINLDALASSGLFLIHGPTGAGKTSILDAICFALYAAVPGSRSGTRASLRSDHAAVGVNPEVTLEFTAGGRRFRVCRSPEFNRPKKRGTGDTAVPAKVVLDELVASIWVNRGTRSDEVALVLKDVLGMGLEQFIKVVLLPQGDFAAFLRASPEDRRTLLEKLFDTKRFADIEAWFAERRRLTATSAGSARDRLATGLLRVDDVMARLDDDIDITAAPWSEVPPAEVGAVLAALLTAVDARASNALAAVEGARAEVARTESALHVGTAVVGHHETAARARARLSALDEQLGACQAAQLDLDLAERAGAVSGFVAAVKSAGQRCETSAGTVAGRRVPLALVIGEDADLSAVRSAVDQLEGHGGALQQVVALSDRADKLSRESARHTETAILQGQASADLAVARAEAETRRAESEKVRDAARTALAEIPALEARRKTLARALALLADLDRSVVDLEGFERQVDCADRLSLQTRERLVDLRERRLAGMAAELAQGLAAGDPCPVCGSCAHPIPATTSNAVRPQDIASAEDEQARAAEALALVRAKVAAELASRDVRAAELTALGLAATAAELPEALLACVGAIDEAQTAAARLLAAETQMQALAVDIERLRGQVEQGMAARAAMLALASSTHQQAEAAGQEVRAQLAAHRDSCRCHPGEGGLPAADLTEIADAADVLSYHTLTLTLLRSLGAALEELTTHQTSLGDALRRMSAALHDNGLETMEQAQGAELPTARAAELTALLRTSERQRAEATALLDQPEVVAALAVPSPDVEVLAQAHLQAAASLADAGRLHTLSEQAKRDLRVLSATVRQAVADLGPAEQEAKLVQELADCVAGNSSNNALRMRLSSYVLAARLVEIATLANERLGTMSDGRYALEYTDARAARGARSGLGLLVRDAWTGMTRETSSLSGGEAFMASLALALGLGDAVRAEAGGLDLQTLFVDEGFGSLDAESLEQVMAVLDTLREGGRAVGIVSHVTELRARIPHQLEVTKAREGSHICTAPGTSLDSSVA
ncbi:MAG: SMC family ATPase [Actinomycetota bacterium]